MTKVREVVDTFPVTEGHVCTVEVFLAPFGPTLEVVVRTTDGRRCQSFTLAGRFAPQLERAIRMAFCKLVEMPRQSYQSAHTWHRPDARALVASIVDADSPYAPEPKGAAR
jgi:hypothetical protein